ncbi:MAG: pyrimidine 5'-nucleotidase [Rhodospirillaceae bacterium]|nr:pyrimidine 5'-nucleotidase [Rhodospirillaceae bacterium]
MADQGAFAHIEDWIFDLDNTLYPASCRLFDQVDKRIGSYISTLLSLDEIEARKIQKQYFRDYGTTLRGLMTRHDVDPHDFLHYVHAIDRSPVATNPVLCTALDALPGRKFIFTNGSVAHAEAVLERLGIGGRFADIFDIVAAEFEPKPQEAPYRRMVERNRITAKRAAMIDDLPVNLVPAAALGMTTVLVRTDSQWAQEAADGEHVHHVIDDLADWLATLVATLKPAPARPTDQRQTET